MNILLAGATGYAGYTIATTLRQAGHQVTALVRRPDSARARSLRQQEIDLLPGDLRQPVTYRAALEACDVCITTVLDFQDPVGTDHLLLETLRAVPARADGSSRLVIYTTGCLVYGYVPERLLDETTPGNPAHPLHFRMELEQDVLQLRNWRSVVVRPGFLYGLDGYSCFATTWFEQGESGRVLFDGDPTKGWSWVHVADLADAYRRMVEHPALDQEIFCVADELQPSCLAVATAAARAAGFTGELEHGPAHMEDWSALFEQNQFITSAKARRRLGWKPAQAGVLAHIDSCYQGWRASQSSDSMGSSITPLRS